MTTPSNISPGLDVVRKKPGMYLGGTDQRALNGCALEVLANSIEEHLAGRGSRITATLHDDGSMSVSDEGGGISVDPDPRLQMPYIELVLATLHAPIDYQRRPFPVLGHCGVGTKCVNAVSEWMVVKTRWGGRGYEIRFSRGHIQGQLRLSEEQSLRPGTTVKFKVEAIRLPGRFECAGRRVADGSSVRGFNER